MDVFSLTRQNLDFCWFCLQIFKSCLKCGGVTFVWHCCVRGLFHAYLSVRFPVIFCWKKSETICVSHVSVHMDLDTCACRCACSRMSENTRPGCRGHRSLTDRREGECLQTLLCLDETATHSLATTDSFLGPVYRTSGLKKLQLLSFTLSSSLCTCFRHERWAQ